MKSDRIITRLAGILLFLSIVLTFVWLLPKNSSGSQELNFKEAISKIEKMEISEVIADENKFELINKDKEKFFTTAANPTQMELIFNAFDRVNGQKPGTIKINIKPASSGWGRIVLLNTLPFFIMWGLTLGVIVYAVRTLSRNKG